MKLRFRRAQPPAHRQKGQALVLGMFILVIVAMLTFFQFSTGQVTTARMRLVNATDAAAYSAGLWRARVFNYYAYSNRAIIFNEVAIGQTATMMSYAGFLVQVVNNLREYTGFIPVWRNIIQGIEEVAEGLKYVMHIISAVEVGVRSGYIQALSAGQTAMWATTSGFYLSQLSKEVMRQTDPSFFGFVPETAEDLSRPYEGADRDRLRSMVNESLDPYSKDRSTHVRIHLPEKVYSFEWRGQTEMVRDHKASFDRWQAFDTLSLHSKSRFSHKRRKWREMVPLGWSGFEFAKGPNDFMDAIRRLSGGRWQDSFLQQNEVGRASEQKTRNTLAYNLINQSEFWSTGTYQGLSAVRDIDFDRLRNKGMNHRFPVDDVVVVGWIRKKNTIDTAAQTGMGAGRLALKDNFAEPGTLARHALKEESHPAMQAVSMARVYFRRPPGADARLEYASMYSPYWQVRLAEVPVSVRTAVGLGGRSFKDLEGLTDD